MGRPKKISEEQLIAGTKQYFDEICKGNTKMLKYPAIAAYLSGLYRIPIADYDLKKSKAVREYISAIKSVRNKEIIQKDIYFKRLDVENFLRTNTSTSSLKKALTELDSHYEKVSDAAGVVMDENRHLIELVVKLQKENQILKASNMELERQVVTTENELKEIHKVARIQEIRTRNLVHILEKNVYPEIANELLIESGFLKNNNRVISEQGIAAIMNDTDSILPFIVEQSGSEKCEDSKSQKPENKEKPENMIEDLVRDLEKF